MTSLQSMLDRVDASPVTGHQKLILYKAGVCPQMTWPPLDELPITWIE